ncbi:uncharacterized protein C6orf136 homolog isoform X2 [Dendronephthya gigantea]|uniref:uncharacterized protein C6orf136 homolog isoform X2 n=1 Tax=Dendronephthya gigantea TaxID=151771 RepID=UPI00106B2CBD|nr:uncharacterized protein C6orf136 homolog isoform X2 [Dendronephthya gigantea]
MLDQNTVQQECNFFHVWTNVRKFQQSHYHKLLQRRKTQEQLIKENLVGVNDEMWYLAKIDGECPKKDLRDNVVQLRNSIVQNKAQCSKDDSVIKRRTSSGPSSEQLALVHLKLREELPSFFYGHHQYSIYSKNILFDNKLTRTRTRTLKSYKYIMNLMAYAGRFFWTGATLDIIRITKHSEDNTIRVRWTAKGIPWYRLPFFSLSGKPQSLFYRYVDGFSIFEVGRDGLVHCHRLDKVIPASTPERQTWRDHQNAGFIFVEPGRDQARTVSL